LKENINNFIYLISCFFVHIIKFVLW